MKDLVSIIIPCYNQAQYLEAALASVLQQTHGNWECLVINDGSADETATVAMNWCEKDVRFQYHHKNNGGLSSARNFGLEKVNGQYIQFLDADDCLDENKLLFSLEALSKTEYQFVGIAISDFRMFTTDSRKSTPPYCSLSQDKFSFDNILYNWDNFFSIPIHCGFFAATLFEGFRFNENLKAKEDWVMWVTLFKEDPKVVFLDLPLAFYRINLNGMTSTLRMEADFLLAYEYLGTIITEAQWKKLSVALISRYYGKSSFFMSKLHQVKQSNTYKLGFLFKEIIRKAGLLKPAKAIFLKLSRYLN